MESVVCWLVGWLLICKSAEHPWLLASVETGVYGDLF